MGKLKTTAMGLCLLITCVVLTGCGSVNYAPGKVYMDPNVGVSVS